MTVNKAHKSHLEFAIIGGGVAGLTLAIALLRRGLKVEIFEQAGQFQEIGAGVSFTPNAVQAMKICDPAIHEAFERVCTRNIWPSKQKTWFDYYDAQSENATSSPVFSITNDLGQNGVHRAHFLDELIKLVPPQAAHFGKKLDKYEEDKHGRLHLSFTDGSEHQADVLLACDGIKSKVRQLLFGAHHPCANPSYTHKYAYRALVPMDAAIDSLGEERAQNAAMHMGKGGHVLTFPINHGQTVNVVAFHTTSDPWPDSSKLTAPSTREEALRDFAHFRPEITNLLKLASPNLDVWAIFDLGDNPPPTFAKGPVCLVGDAAHATSPHHGAGAGFCIEDAAVLAQLFANDEILDRTAVQVALAVYDACRRERASWLVQSSRHIGNTYEWIAEGIENDFTKIQEEITHRNGVIANADIMAMCDEAKDEFCKRWASKASATA
ncbi:hypothetical protein E4U24_004225 [Claviceps purpurea]|nr:hypothetical protein E4U37_007385 [Claviceps purpurea]KAG6160923.1 hypothetical protein E4U51_007364 [Claviceps purpurea]KAG6176226.1 hypothetical protein E4U36_008116 [Claviceps purpurea]KAG6178645.1 hypothetical protein E4U27_003627 [Claviceps purpurea]KAG6178709.1 hypothetical protein E4U10_008104 [Claviceps purpurea]